MGVKRGLILLRENSKVSSSVTGQAVYVWRNIGTHSCNHCCSGKAISNTYSECVSVAFGIQHASAHAPHCHMCPAWLYNIFPHYLIHGKIFEKKVTEHKMCVFDFLYKFSLKYFSFYEETSEVWLKKPCIGLQVKYPLFLSDLIYLWTAIGCPPGGSSTVHIYTQTIHRTTHNKQYIEQHKNFGRVRAVLRLCGLYPGICLTTQEKARKNLSQGSRRVPAGTTRIHKHTIRIHRHNNNNI
jgi:hypothetical protein